MSTDSVTLSKDTAERLLRLARGWQEGKAIRDLENALLISPLESKLAELEVVARRQYVDASTGKALLLAALTLSSLYEKTVNAEALSTDLIRQAILNGLS